VIILHVIYDDIENPWCGGGGALRVLEVNKHLSREHQITVLSGNFPGALDQKRGRVLYKRLGTSASYVMSRLSFALLAPFHIRKFKADIVVNECSFFAPCFADLYTRKPVVNIIHHIMRTHALRIHPLYGFFPLVAEKLFLKTARNVITSTHRVKEFFRNLDVHKKVVSIPNGVSDDLFTLPPEEKGFILFLGRIDLYMKGLDILIEAFSRIRSRDVSLKIAGSGKKGDVKKLIRKIRDYGIEGRTAYLGRVNEEGKKELLRTCLFLVMPSRFEGWGITAVEANAAAKPILGTKIWGLTEAVGDGTTGLLVEPNNVEKLAASMDLLLENSTLRNHLGKEGREWAKRFLWKSIAEEQFAFYRTVINKS
jgi:glycosyltransferase involved in cell wall biosynthesis